MSTPGFEFLRAETFPEDPRQALAHALALKDTLDMETGAALWQSPDSGDFLLLVEEDADRERMERRFYRLARTRGLCPTFTGFSLRRE